MKFSGAKRFFLWMLILSGFTSCNITKYVPEGEYLLDKVEIKSDSKEYGSSELNPYVKQRPNFKMFGFNKTQLQIYSLSGRDSTKWLSRFLRKAGDPPVIFDSLLVEKTENEFRKFFINKGYINVNVSSETHTHNKKAEVIYYITTNEPYRIRYYDAEIEDPAIYEELYRNEGHPFRVSAEPSSLRTSLVKPEMLFDRDILDKERERITRLLRNRGYFAFEKDYITYDADSTILPNSVDLLMRLHLYPDILPSGIYTEIPHNKYHLDRIFFYTDYDPLRFISNEDTYIARDSVQRGNYTVYSPHESLSIKPDLLFSNTYLIPGHLYSQAGEEMTYTALAGLPALSTVNVRYEEFLRNDTTFLNAYILTVPEKKQSISFSIEGTNSDGDLGFATSVGYTHRNLFKGSEVLNFKVRGAYEAISDNFAKNYFEYGVETSLRFPNFLFPFLNPNFKRRVRASTELSFGYNYQTRYEYDRILLSGGIKYVWQNRGIGFGRHQVNLIDINYIYLPRISQDFLNILPDDAVYFGYTSQFIAGIGYSYSRSTFNPFQRQRNAYSIRGSVETSGNVLYLFSRWLDTQKNENGSYELMGIPFAQYVKGDIEYSKTIFIDKNNSFAWRVGGGIALPYANNRSIPFEKRYYSGGANSVRAWSVRSLGPGSYVANDTTTFYEHSGDIKLDLNIEYRTRFFWKFEMAAYVDAGNIWTIRNYEGQPGGLFRFDSFYKEIALGYGLGLRLDFDFFLVRFDTGMKAYDPEKRSKEKWAFLHPNFRNNFAWHFAVGYPF